MRLYFHLFAALAGMVLFSFPAAAQQEKSVLSKPVREEYANVNNVRIYYQIYGKGDPIVLLHGGFGSIESFGSVIDRLAAEHLVIGIDLQGHGRTPPHDRTMTFEAMAEDVAQLIEQLSVGPVNVLAYSTGGSVAIHLAADHPTLVRRLILVSTPFSRSGWHEYNQNGMAQIGEHSAEPMKATPIYEAYSRIAPDPEQNWPKLHKQIGRLQNEPYDHSFKVRVIRAPTMLIYGDHDSIRPSHAVSFFEMLGGGLADAQWDGSGIVKHRLAVIPGLTHYTIFNSPVIADLAMKFLYHPESDKPN